jgi:HEAT repeat protein
MGDGAAAYAARLQELRAAAEASALEAAIVEGLGAGAPPVREVAIAWAARCLEPELLARFVADEADAVRRNAALAALERQGPYAVAHLEQVLDAPDADLVMFALQVLGRIGDAGTARRILPLVTHPSPNLAQAAIEALGRLRSVEAVPLLLEQLQADLWLQLAAIQALGEIGAVEAALPLAALVPDSPLAVPVLEALGKLRDARTAPVLAALLRDPAHPELREPALLALGQVLEAADVPLDHLAVLASDLERDAGLRRWLESCLTPQARDAAALPGQGTRDDRGTPRDGGALVRAAALVVLASGARSLLPAVMAWGAEPEALGWLDGAVRRFGPRVQSGLEALLAHPEPRVRAGVIAVLPFTPAQVPDLVRLASAEAAVVRRAACRALGRLGDPRAVPALIERLRSGEAGERAAAVEALGAMPGEGLEPLGDCLADTEPAPVRAAALDAVGRTGSRQFDLRAVALTRDPDPAVRVAALRVLATQPGARGLVFLLRALADRSEAVQLEALDLLVRHGGGSAVRMLLPFLYTGDSLRYHVIRALGRLGAAEAGPPLEALYETAPLHERIEILGALARIAPPSARGFLAARLAEPEAEIRRAAARGLAALADPEDLPLFERLGREDDWALRHEAARALARLDEPRARALLLELARDLEPVVAAAAREALARQAGGAS